MSAILYTPLLFTVGESVPQGRSQPLEYAYARYLSAQKDYASVRNQLSDAQSRQAKNPKDKNAAADVRNAQNRLKSATTALSSALDDYTFQAEQERKAAENEARIAQAQYDVIAAQQKAVTITAATQQMVQIAEQEKADAKEKTDQVTEGKDSPVSVPSIPAPMVSGSVDFSSQQIAIAAGGVLVIGLGAWLLMRR